MKSIWDILGIPPTNDKATIKRAYIAKLKSTNPEDDPDGFKKLRAAYEKLINQKAAKKTIVSNPIKYQFNYYGNSQTYSTKPKKTPLAEKLIQYLQQRGEQAAIRKFDWIIRTGHLNNLSNKFEFEGELKKALAKLDLLPYSFFEKMVSYFQWELEKNKPIDRNFFRLLESYECCQYLETLARHQQYHLPIGLLLGEYHKETFTRFCKKKSNQRIMAALLVKLRQQFPEGLALTVPKKNLLWFWEQCSSASTSIQSSHSSISLSKTSKPWSTGKIVFYSFIALAILGSFLQKKPDNQNNHANELAVYTSPVNSRTCKQNPYDPSCPKLRPLARFCVEHPVDSLC